MVTMAAEIIYTRKGKSPGFFNSLSSAACEWFLILLLFMIALLSCLAEKFARYCELNSPCMLCSRLDRVLEKAKPGGYWNLLCKNHREEISSLVSCSVHCNLADSHGMCEGCAIDSFDHFSPHVGYAKSKRSSDSELVDHYEDDDSRNLCYCQKYGSKNGEDSCLSRSRPETPVNNVALDKWSHKGFEVKPSVLDQPNLVDSKDSMNVISSALDAFKECGPGNVDWAESYLGPCSCLRADMTILNYDLKHDVGVAETSKCNTSLLHTPALPFVSELLSLYDVPSLDNMVPIPQKSIDVFETSENENTVATKHTEAAAGSSFDKVCSSYSNDTDLSEPLTLSHSIKNESISGQSVVQPIFLHDAVKIRDDVNSLEPISVTGSSFNNNGHNTHYQHNESRENYECRFHWLPFSLSLVGSSYESLDEISFYGAEGESTVDRLKREVEKYRRCVDILFRELEEERNAAAIAANQAMAMITRLQEQKAAFRMEALQYLRVLEEQAEYVSEELERTNDLLAEKEDELQALKTELELGVNAFLYESSVDDPHREILKVPNHDISHVEYSPCTLTNSISARVNYEDEKLYISESLKNLCQVYCCRRVDDMPNGLCPEKGKIEVENLDDLNREILSNKEDEGSDSFVQRVVLESIMSLSQNGTSNVPPAHFKSPDMMWGNGFVGEMNKTLSFSTSIVEITSATIES
ncbi:probable myosin-binding protein 5 [Primulina huaijiensis]|uniref:probable myosin-binding protein 5 n=1 Tax=Primulina huaijiensis TaxID=1492673 RepID=UPI003CC712A4